jgi:hypothetical protein
MGVRLSAGLFLLATVSAIVISGCAETLLPYGQEKYLKDLEQVKDTVKYVENPPLSKSQSRFFPFFAFGSFEEAKLNYIGELRVYKDAIVFESKDSGTEYAMPSLNPILLSVEKIEGWSLTNNEGIDLLVKYGGKKYLFLIRPGTNVSDYLKSILKDKPKLDLSK